MKLIPAADFVRQRLLGEGPDRHMPALWRAMPGAADVAGSPNGSNGRVIRYLLSDSSIARDGHTIATKGWELDNYLKNPVVLWAHDSSEPPIGRMVEIGAVGDRLMGSVEYPDREVYPFADTVYQLVRGGYLNAVSVGWLPLEWKFSQDRGRPGGIDFQRAELIEVSQVPVPALPSALADARAAGIDTGPLYAWAEKLLNGGEKVVVPRREIEELRRAAKMPTPKSHAAAESPQAQEEEIIAAALAAEKRAMRRHEAWQGLQRDLYNCGWLAQLLDSAAFLEEMVEWEESLEGDDHTISDRIVAIMKLMGSLLVDMTAAEVEKLLAEEAMEDHGTPALRLLRAIARNFTGKAAAAPARAPLPAPACDDDAAQIIPGAQTRAGRVLSAANEATLRQAHEMISSVLDQVAPGDDQDPIIVVSPDDVEAERARARAKTTLWRIAPKGLTAAA